MTHLRVFLPLLVVLAMVVVAALMVTPRTSSAPVESPSSLPMQPIPATVVSPSCRASAYAPGDLIGEANPASLDPASGCP